MWTCPNCGREFKNTNQSHYCKTAPKTIDEYIDAQPSELRPCLAAVRQAIHTAIPDAEERIAWSMPTFWKGKNIIHFAANKKHIGLYPGEEAIIHFAEELQAYKTNKGTLQIPYDDHIPLDLISQIAIWCCEQ